MSNKRAHIFLFFWITLLCACNSDNAEHMQYKRYTYTQPPAKTFLHAQDIEIFQGTPVWDLAIVVYEQDTNKIKEIAKKKTRAEISLITEQRCMTLLSWAIYNNRYYSSKALLETGADPNTNCCDDLSPFSCAAYHEETSAYLRLLLQYGGNVNATFKQGNTPLQEACASHRLENVQLLVKAGADVNHFDTVNKNALFTAVATRSPDIIYYLISEAHADFRKPLIVYTDGTRSTYFKELINDMQPFPSEHDDSMIKKIKRYIVTH